MGKSLTVRAAGLLVLPALALLLLAAHFLHAGLEAVAALALLLVGLLFVPRPWAARSLQIVLAAGALEWLLTASALARLRAERGEPFLRLVAILGTVALLTTLAAALFQHPLLRARFGLNRARVAATPEGSTN